MTPRKIALKMLLYNRLRLLVAVVGVVFAFFLTAAQSGILIGWCNTVSAIIRNANVDLWIMAPQTQAFEYGSVVSRGNVFLARSVTGVEWADGVLLVWNYWHRSDGKRITTEILALNDDCIGGPWKMKEGTVQAVLAPRGIIVDEYFLDTMGIANIGDEGEVWDKKAVVTGICTGIRTFTTSPIIFTALHTLTGWDPLVSDNSVTYVLVKLSPGASASKVREDMQKTIPYLDVLTTREFALRTIQYWMLSTGAGLTVVAIAILGLLVGSVIISQTLYATTLDHLADYATLLALGFEKWRLARVVIIQSLLTGTMGIALGSVFFFVMARLSTTGPLPMETTPAVFVGIVVVTLGCCVLASFISVRSIFGIDPVTVFKG